MESPEKNENCFYFDITTQERDSAIRYLLGAIIKCRKESNFPSNRYVFDEDVNVYLAHLLFAVSLPEYHEMSEPYLSLDTSDIINWVRATEDRTIRYFIFKVNADNILIHTAIFDDILKKPSPKLMKRSPKHFRELAQLYYDQASQYHQRIYRKQTGVGEVLQKIARHYEEYQDILKQVRREYFNFMNNFRDQVFTQFVEQVKTYESQTLKQVRVDELLDLYSQWLNNKDPFLKMKIRQSAEEIRRIDPTFHFMLDLDEGEDHERKCA